MTPNTIAEAQECRDAFEKRYFGGEQNLIDEARLGDGYRHPHGYVWQGHRYGWQAHAQLSDAPDVEATADAVGERMNGMQIEDGVDIVTPIVRATLDHLAAAGHLRPAEAGAQRMFTVKENYTMPSGTDVDAEHLFRTAAVPSIREDLEKVRDDLSSIGTWFGQFPEVDGKSYASAYGSNGERDFMRGKAKKAAAFLDRIIAAQGGET